MNIRSPRLRAVSGPHLELHFGVLRLLPLLHESQAEGLEVDLVLGLLDDLPQESPGCSQIVIFVGQ